MQTLDNIIQPEVWTRALEKYAAATRLTVAVWGPSRDLLLGPIQSSPLFEATGGSGNILHTSCVARCFEDRGGPVMTDDFSFSVIGTPLVIHGAPVGAVTAGPALTAFPNEMLIGRFAVQQQLPFSQLWRTVRHQAPLTAGRLRVYGELLQALVETLLNESLRSDEHRQALLHLAAANRAKDEFLAMLSHELRNPLAPIQIAMQIIGRADAGDAMVDKARETVNRQVRLLARLLDDLLEVSRITRGTVELRKQPVNITTSVANALDATRSFIDAREHSLTVSVPEQPLVLDADPVRIEQIITNLVLNAAKYTPPKGIVVVSASRQHDEAVIRVRDNGIGIPGDLLPRVFDMFTQGDRSLAHSGGGLGVGLTIVRKLVELHGGTVGVESEGPGRGSEFTVRLPIRPPIQDLPLVKSPAVPKVRTERAHILVVEDNPDSREMLKALLEASGHDVRIANDGPGGVEAARLYRPDLALIDIGLPGFDGYEVARRIRRHLGPGVRLIAVTGYGQAEDQRLTAAAGFDLHLVKPVSPEQLDQVIGGLRGARPN
jgi:signal transduction histidine kinase/CheY-like chemotaxis protein